MNYSVGCISVRWFAADDRLCTVVDRSFARVSWSWLPRGTQATDTTKRCRAARWRESHAQHQRSGTPSRDHGGVHASRLPHVMGFYFSSKAHGRRLPKPDLVAPGEGCHCGGRDAQERAQGHAE